MPDMSALAAGWDRAYLGTPPWDIGRPQRAFADAVARLAGTVIEFGCGTGEQTILAATGGATAVGLDISARAIASARAKAAAREVDARFGVADILDAGTLPGDLAGTADVLIDSGTFHMFDASDRRRYAASAERVLRPHSRCLLLCARPDPARHWGPPGLDPADAAGSFDGGWRVADVTATVFEVAAPLGDVAANLITLARVGA